MPVKTADGAESKGEAPQELQAMPGSSQAAGTSFEPADPLLSAAPSVPEVTRPRPSTTRFPIGVEEFLTLKSRAADPDSLSVDKPASTLVSDQGEKFELASTTMADLLTAGPAGPVSAAATAVNFAGISATGWLPPDCTIAVGQQHVLVAVNSSVHIYGKAGGAPALQRTLTQWFSNAIQGAKIFDPKVLYDQHAGRWILVAVALPGNTAEQGSWFLVSVSKTQDPLGGWWNYRLDAKQDGKKDTDNWADYPGIGVDSHALYLTANMFQFNGGFAYAKLRIVPKQALYSGGQPTWVDFVGMQNEDGSKAFTIQPCHTFGAPQVQNFVNSLFPSLAGQTRNTVTVWSLRDPVGSPALSRRTVQCDPYGLPPDANQQGGGTPLDTGDVRVLHAVSRAGTIFAALTTVHNWGEPVNRAAVHWFQINGTSGALVQQGIYGATALNYFYPALTADTNGNVGIVFARCGDSEFASVYFAVRLATDALGRFQPSVLLKAGNANYVGTDGFGRNRWGDYSGVATDPADPKAIWFYGGYASAPNVWATWIGSTRF
jgi:hypothetical protein